MSLFRVMREEDDEEFGHIQAYLSEEKEWDVEEKASTFSSREEAISALNDDPYDHTGDYQYHIEKV